MNSVREFKRNMRAIRGSDIELNKNNIGVIAQAVAPLVADGVVTKRERRVLRNQAKRIGSDVASRYLNRAARGKERQLRVIEKAEALVGDGLLTGKEVARLVDLAKKDGVTPLEALRITDVVLEQLEGWGMDVGVLDGISERLQAVLEPGVFTSQTAADALSALPPAANRILQVVQRVHDVAERLQSGASSDSLRAEALSRLQGFLSGFNGSEADGLNAIEALVDVDPDFDLPTLTFQSATATSTATRIYTVREGDTLSGIAARELGDADRWPEIATLNNLSDPDSISVGQQLRIPVPVSSPPPPVGPPPPTNTRTYTVRSGDTLSAIAQRELGSANRWPEIARLNNISNPERIEVGQVLQLPGSAPVGPVNPPGTGNGNAVQLSLGQLRQIVPSIGRKALYNNGIFTGRYGDRTLAEQQQLLDGLNQSMRELGITSPTEAAMYVAQLAHESAGFTTFQEFASGAAYEGRLDLGNTQPGDGRRFKGRGAIQLTGRANYAAASRALFPDDPTYLLRNPAAVEQQPLAFQVSAYYWQTRSGLRSAAQRGDLNRTTRLINGGTNGLADRRAYYNRAINVV